MAATATPIALVLGVPQTIELSNVVGTCARIDPPANARVVKVQPITSDIELVRGGTDTTVITPGTTGAEVVHGDETLQLRVPGSGSGTMRNTDSAAAASNSRRFCLAPTVASSKVRVVALS